jgi:nucleotide-binding universal stress UspA family protein
LVASDGSHHEEAAVRTAVEMAKRCGAELVLITVAETTRGINALFNPLQVSEQMEIIHRATEATQDRIEEEAEEQAERAGITFHARREQGHPADRIVAAAKEEKADLIVVGARGLGAFAALMLGSVSTGVIHHAPCSVLVVK